MTAASSDTPKGLGHGAWKWAGVVVLATLVFGSVSLIYPFGRDQGIHAFIADSVLHGKVLYRDIFNIKPPLTTGVHALALLLFGHSMTAIRVLDLLWTVATSLLVFAFVRQAFGHLRAAALAGILYAFQYYGYDFWNTSQTDGWLNLPLAAAFLLALRGLRQGAGSRWVWLGAGVGIGLAAAFKYTVILACPLLAVIIALWGTESRVRRLATAGWLIAGTALVMVSLGIALAARGAMPAFLQSQFGLAPAYARLAAYRGNPIVGFITPLLESAQLFSTLVSGLVGVLVISLLLHLRPERRLDLALVLAWAVTAVVSTVIQRKFFLYQYLPLLTVTSIGAGLGLAVPMRRLALRRLFMGLSVAAALLLLGTSSYRDRFADVRAVITGQRSLREHWDSPLYHFDVDFSLRDDLALADHLKAHTGPQQPVFLWGFEPLVYFVSQRPLVSRFAYNYPLVFRWRPEQFRAELMASLSAHAPEIFVVQHNDRLPQVTIHQADSFETFQAFKELRDWVNERYHMETRIGRFDVYRRRVEPPRI